jgi:hypothetical protein
MKQVLTTAAVTLIVIEAIAFSQSGSGADSASFGSINILMSLVLFFIGLMLLFSRQTLDVAKGILLGTGIALLIGLAVCSGGNLL